MYASFHKRRVRVLDSYMHYVETRAGEHTVILLHGNMTSSYVWRDVIPGIQGYARCIAPDLLGMGLSGVNAENEYGFETQYLYICEWLQLLRLDKREKIVFVAHEWGVALAARWIYEHPEKVKGFVHMEGIIAPIRSLQDINCKMIQHLYRETKGNMDDHQNKHPHHQIKGNLVTYKNPHLNHQTKGKMDPNRNRHQCHETICNNDQPNGLNVSSLDSTACMINHYEIITTSTDDVTKLTTPPNTSSKCLTQAILNWTRDLPIQGSTPLETLCTLRKIDKWMSQAWTLPELHIEAEPGINSAWVAESVIEWPNQTTVVVSARALPPVACPLQVAQAIVDFLKSL